jgi:CDP-diacylglycerol--serine O-phosphatidyltransferase
MSVLRQKFRRPLKPKRYRATRLFPSVLTSAGVACGLLAIIHCMDGAAELAAWMILVAFVCDALDGKIAKLLKVSSPLGVQLDSLGDVISFGVAPAMMLRTVLYPTSHKLGISLMLAYVLCTALRLARYNVMSSDAPRLHFTGLPCPAAAGLLASTVLVLKLHNVDLSVIGPLRVGIHIMTVILSILMVSRVPYPDLMVRYLERRSNFSHTVAIALGVSLGILNPQATMVLCFGAYVLLGPVLLRHDRRVHVTKSDGEVVSVGRDVEK